jgi:SpoVK/Ycf46/Vps4 family AAA+-type ATPase
VVSIPQTTLNKFIEFDENVEFYIILSLWLAKDGKRKYQQGSRELLVHALSDTGIGVEPMVDPRIASLSVTDQEKTDSNVIAISPLFAALHGIKHGDWCHVRRVRHTSVLLDSVSLLPLAPVDGYDRKELVDCLLSKAHLVAQDGLILVSYPKSAAISSQSQSLSSGNGLENPTKRDVSSKSSSVDPNDPLSKSYLGFIVLDAGQVCQGVLTRKTTIFIVPPSSSPGSLPPPSDKSSTPWKFDTMMHELYYTSFANGNISARYTGVISEKPSLLASMGPSSQIGTNGTPNKPLMRSSMLVVPLGASPLSSPLGPSQALSSSLRSPKSLSGTASSSTPDFYKSKSNAKTPNTGRTTPSLSPSSLASSSVDSHRDVFNRSLLRVEVVREPLRKLVSRPKSNLAPGGHNSASLGHSFDEDATIEVGVSLETMKQQMVGVFNSSWVEVSVSSSNSTQLASATPTSTAHANMEQKRQLARIYVVEDASDFTLYVPPNLAFMLGIDPQSNTTLAKVSPSLAIDAFLKDPTQQTPEIGKIESLHFALIPQPSNPHFNLSSKALVKYFGQPRIMRPGQVFAVVVNLPRFVEPFINPFLGDGADSDSDLEYESNETEQTALEATQSLQQVVYFKITSIHFAAPLAGASEGQTPYYAYIPAKPNAISDGIVHSRVPPDFANFLLNSLHRHSSNSLSGTLPGFARPSIQSINSLQRLPYSDSMEGRQSPAGLTEPFEELLAICRPCLHPMSASFGLTASVLTHGARGSGKTHVARQVAAVLGISVFEVNCYDLIGHSDVETEKKLSACFEEAASYAPVLLLLSEFDAFDATKAEASSEPPIANAIKEQLSSLPSIHQRTGYPVMVVATAQNASEISRNLRSLFRVEIGFSSPDEMNRMAMLLAIFQEESGRTPLHRAVRLKELALKTASFQRKTLASLAQKARELAIKRVLGYQTARLKKTSRAMEMISNMECDMVCAGICVTSEDIDQALDLMHAANATTLGTPKIPQVKWEDVGGLMEAKREILDTIQLPLQHPELFAKGASTRSGILLYGPPGTGKTLLAKAVATECSLNFISVKGPELINMYIGESEKNVREVFQRARDARPCVIFFDELDSLAPNRGRSGDSGGVMDRIVSQLLAELSDMSQKTDVFVIGATNRPDLIDPALLVPGRFDKLIFLGVNAEVSQKHNVLTALTRKFNLGSTVNLHEIAKSCPINLTGADLYALCSDAMATAIKSQIQAVQQLSQDKLDQLKRDETSLPVTVEQEHFVSALQRLNPSVSMEELERYKDMANKFQKKA